MALDAIRIGFLPLVDAALPILAREQGFAEAEGLAIELVRDMTWATVRDRLLYGHTDAAHLVAPLAIAAALGRGRPAVPMAVPFVLGLNGNAITLAVPLAAMVMDGDALGDPVALGIRLKAVALARLAAGRPLRFGVVHRYSSHNYMLRYWLAAVGIRPDIDCEIVTTSPPFAADALAAGEVDGICVGEPWNSIAVDRGVGRIVLVTAQLWRRGVEKVLAMRSDTLAGHTRHGTPPDSGAARSGEAFRRPRHARPERGDPGAPGLSRRAGRADPARDHGPRPTEP